jgi:hypothetical protein
MPETVEGSRVVATRPGFTVPVAPCTAYDRASTAGHLEQHHRWLSPPRQLKGRGQTFGIG